MENDVAAESGVQLLTRLHKRPSLHHLDDILFPEGPEPGDIIQISGESSVGKTLLLLKFLTKSLLPKKYEGVELGGLEVGVILINTDHSISILKLVSLMELYIDNAFCQVNKEGELNTNKKEKLIIECLKRLIILETYSSLQMEMNFYSLEKVLSVDNRMALIVIDSLTAFYWSDTANEKSVKKMDLYLKIWIDKLQKCINDFKMVVVFTIQGCGYKSRFDELSSSIKSAFPDVEINSTQGRTGSFEIQINDVLVYSKLQRFAFPDYDGVVEVVEEVQKGMPPREVNKQQSYTSNCTIL